MYYTKLLTSKTEIVSGCGISYLLCPVWFVFLFVFLLFNYLLKCMCLNTVYWKTKLYFPNPNKKSSTLYFILFHLHQIDAFVCMFSFSTRQLLRIHLSLNWLQHFKFSTQIKFNYQYWDLISNDYAFRAEKQKIKNK